MAWSPSVTVAAVIRDRDRYLMVEERPDGHAVINQPAGHLEFGETLLEAVGREVLEETTRVFTPQGLVGVYQWTLPCSERTYLRFCFVGEVGDPLRGHSLDPDITTTHWLTAEQIRCGSLPPRSPLVLRCLHDAENLTPRALDCLHALT
ncbi:MAG: NUDIX hydrolase [Chromatiaceae bacterium]|nr:NUDIX hydrolase [Chromatiaceae bacterium]